MWDYNLKTSGCSRAMLDVTEASIAELDALHEWIATQDVDVWQYERGGREWVELTPTRERRSA